MTAMNVNYINKSKRIVIMELSAHRFQVTDLRHPDANKNIRIKTHKL